MLYYDYDYDAPLPLIKKVRIRMQLTSVCGVCVRTSNGWSNVAAMLGRIDGMVARQ